MYQSLKNRAWLSALGLVCLVGCGGAYKEASYGGSSGYPVAAQGQSVREEHYAMDDSGADGYRGAPQEYLAEAPMPTGTSKSAPESAPAPPQAPETRSDASTGVIGSESAVQAPMLIYRAEINIAVFEARKVVEQVEKLGRDSGGYLVRRTDEQVVVRVPNNKFREVLAAVEKLGDVLYQNIDVQDVTEEFLDVQIRLKNARAVRERFEQLLTKAQSVEDSLRIERELERITTEIERYEGRLKLLRELVNFSTITVDIRPRGQDQVAPKVDLPFPWLRQLGLPSLLSM